MDVSYGKWLAAAATQGLVGGRGNGEGSRNGHLVRLGPHFFPILEFQLLHRDGEVIVVHLDKQIVIVDAGILVGIVRLPRDGVGMCASAARDEVGDSPCS